MLANPGDFCLEGGGVFLLGNMIMMRLLPLIGAAAVAVTLASCNTMSKEECQVADWRVVGDADGAAGYDPQERFAGHVDSCKKSGSMPDQTLWHEGYQAGIRRYCTPLGGASTGEGGRGYYNVCPPELEPDFMRGYSLGKRVHDLRGRLNTLRSGIKAKEADIDNRTGDLKKARGDERRDLRDKIDDMERDVRRMKREADDADYDLRNAQRDLDHLRQNPMAPPRY